MNYPEDTICALATIPGTGAISVIRISGPDALKATDTIVRFRRGAALSSEGYSLKFGSIYDGKDLLDDVVVAIFRNPHSYTGEDSAEISCHASKYIASRILELLLDAGCRLAKPGEFTQRAFLAGKMDLAQAEAVSDLIQAESRYAHKIALNQLKGGYSKDLAALRDKLLQIASLLELELDFSEEDVEFANRGQLESLLDDAISRIEKLRDSFRQGNAIRKGIPVAIIGSVNSGKSTLLNALVGDQRAIVSDIAGTTRDSIEEVINLGGIQYRFIDTAGLRDTSDKIEKIGIERAYEQLGKAEIVIGVLNAQSSKKECIDDAWKLISHIKEGQKLILVRNKVDIFDAFNPEDFPVRDSSYGIFEIKHPAFGTYDLSPEQLAKAIAKDGREDGAKGTEMAILDISAKTGEGLDELKDAITEYGTKVLNTEDTLVTSERHYEALGNALDSLYATRNSLQSGISTELLAEDLRQSINSMNEIFGIGIGLLASDNTTSGAISTISTISTETILSNIFQHFCIGK